MERALRATCSVLHKHHHALDLRTNSQQLAFHLLPKTVLPRLLQSQTSLWAWYNTTWWWWQWEAGVCSFFICLANFSLLGHVAYTSTHWSPANTHAHKLSVCSTSKLPHRKESFSTVVITTFSLYPISNGMTNPSWGHPESPCWSKLFSSAPVFEHPSWVIENTYHTHIKGNESPSVWSTPESHTSHFTNTTFLFIWESL